MIAESKKKTLAAPPQQKPALSFWQIWNMSFGFLGIQFGWNLQMSNMSAIYEYLGAKPDQLPLLWLAAPLTGLLVQPLIGHMSDNTWNRLGRRKPYFLTGAILSSLGLILMPSSSALWMAAGLLWILDASINISMEPFRAFVGDMLPDSQRTYGFAMQSMFIGLGATIASYLPLMFTTFFGATPSARGVIPDAVRWSFYVGAAAFLSAVLWTVLRTKEYPPDPAQPKPGNRGNLLSEVLDALGNMPSTMKQLAVVQFATWLGLFCMWLYFPVAVARHVFGATDETSALYQEGAAFGGSLFGFYSIVCFLLVDPAALVGPAGPPRNALDVPGLRRLGAAFDRRDPRPEPVVLLHDWRRYRLGQHPLDALRHAGGKPAPASDGDLRRYLQLLYRAAGNSGLDDIRPVDEPCAGQ